MQVFDFEVGVIEGKNISGQKIREVLLDYMEQGQGYFINDKDIVDSLINTFGNAVFQDNARIDKISYTLTDHQSYYVNANNVVPINCNKGNCQDFQQSSAVTEGMVLLLFDAKIACKFGVNQHFLCKPDNSENYTKLGIWGVKENLTWIDLLDGGKQWRKLLKHVSSFYEVGEHEGYSYLGNINIDYFINNIDLIISKKDFYSSPNLLMGGLTTKKSKAYSVRKVFNSVATNKINEFINLQSDTSFDEFKKLNSDNLVWGDQSYTIKPIEAFCSLITDLSESSDIKSVSEIRDAKLERVINLVDKSERPIDKSSMPEGYSLFLRTRDGWMELDSEKIRINNVGDIIQVNHAGKTLANYVFFSKEISKSPILGSCPVKNTNDITKKLDKTNFSKCSYYKIYADKYYFDYFVLFNKSTKNFYNPLNHKVFSDFSSLSQFVKESKFDVHGLEFSNDVLVNDQGVNSGFKVKIKNHDGEYYWRYKNNRYNNKFGSKLLLREKNNYIDF